MPSHIVSSDQVEIDAPAQVVWDILVDLKNYHEWNPFTERVESTLVLGDKVDLYVRLGKQNKIQTEQVREVSPPNTLSWGMTMGLDFLLKALREQKLETVTEDKCVYFSTDAFQGLLTPLVVMLYGEKIRVGFNEMAYALKKRAESQYLDQNKDR